MNNVPNDLMRVSAAAHLLDIHPRTIIRWWHAGHIRLFGRRRTYRVSFTDLSRLADPSNFGPHGPQPTPRKSPRVSTPNSAVGVKNSSAVESATASTAQQKPQKGEL